MCVYLCMIVVVYLELVVAPDREKDLSNPNPSCGAMGLAISTPHSSLEPEHVGLEIVLLDFGHKSKDK